MVNDRQDPDQLQEYDGSGVEHPSTEQILIRTAISKTLNGEQRLIWEMYNYDRLTTVEIADKLGVSQQNISKRISVIERKLTKWCKDHMDVYHTILEANDEK